MSQLCNIRHDIPVTLYTPGAYGQCSVFAHNGDKQSAVFGPRCGTWWPWYGHFEVGWLQPLHLWLSAGNSLAVPVVVSRGKDRCHVASNLYSEHLPVGLYLGRGHFFLVGPLFHFPQCHNSLASSRNEHVCPCHSITRAGSWFGNKRGFDVFTLNCLQTGHCVRVDHYIVMDWAHVLVIVQCRQSDGCIISCKDDAVVRQSFGQLVAGCLFWKWWLMTTAAPTLLFILEPSV